MIQCAYAVIHIKCDQYPRCTANFSITPGLYERNKMLELFEMLSPAELMEQIQKEKPDGWVVESDERALCNVHAA